MMKKRLLVLCPLLLLLATVTLSAQNITGKWYGFPDLGGHRLRIVFEIRSSVEGYTAGMFSLDQGNQEIPASSVSLSDSLLTIAIPAIGFNYRGKLIAGDSINGRFSQMGQTFKMNLSRKPFVRRRPQEPQAPFPYRSEDVFFGQGENAIRLAGTLTLPGKGTKFPAVILVSGSGPQNRNEELMGHKPFLVLADYLSRRGIAVLRYDDRGVGQSGGNFQQATLNDFVSDALAALSYLKTRKEIDPDKIGIIGHSEGGSVAFILAARQKPAFIVTLAGSGVDGKKLLALQREALLKASGAPDQFVTDYNRVFEQAQELVLGRKAGTNLLQEVARIFSGTPLQGQEQLIIKQLNDPGLVSWMQYDPVKDYLNIHCPVLAINGEKDMQVPAKVNLEAIQKGISASGNNQVTVKNYPGLNHLFQTAKTGLPAEYEQIEETFSPVVMKDITDWIRGLTSSPVR